MVQNNIYQVYKVAFKAPPLSDDDRTEFFFTSLAAIYDTFTAAQIGCKATRLWNIGVSKGQRYEGRLCVITREDVVRKTQKQPSRGGTLPR